VADVGLAGDEGHRHLVAQLALAQVGRHDEGELVGRAEAAGARHGADHDRARVLQEFLVVGKPLLGMVDGADRMRVTVDGARARHLVERQLGAGGDDQVVVGQLSPPSSTSLLPGASMAVTAEPMKSMFFLRSGSASGTTMSSRWRQPTATQGWTARTGRSPPR
jgi:hypothetical protein